jgi:hypothetical protein
MNRKMKIQNVNFIPVPEFSQQPNVAFTFHILKVVPVKH